MRSSPKLNRQSTGWQLRASVVELNKHKLNFTIEKERELDAQREWELLGNEGDAPELASRKPQLRLAELGVEAAEAGF